MFNKMQYYVLSKFITPFFVGVIFFLCFLVIFYEFRLIGIMISRDVVLIDSIKMIMYLAVGFLPTVFPLATFFGINYSMNRMSEDSEFVAMRSFGMSKFKILLPVLFFSILVSLCLFSMNQNLIPSYQKLFKNMMLKMSAKGVLTDIKPGQFFNEIPGNILYAKNVNQKTREMSNLFLWQEVDDETKIISAEKGVMLKEYIDKFHTPSLRLHLTKGNVFIKKKGSNSYQKILFEEYDFPLLKGGSSVGSASKESYKTTSELKELIASKKLLITKTKNRNHIKDLIKQIQLAEITYWGRITGAIQIILFAILGFSLGITNNRSQKSNGGFLTFFFLILYYVIFFLGISLSKKGIIHPFLGATLSVPVFTLICWKYYRKIDWAT